MQRAFWLSLFQFLLAAGIFAAEGSVWASGKAYNKLEPVELKEILRRQPPDSVRVEVYQALCRAYNEVMYDSSLHYCHLAQDLAGEMNLKKIQVKTHWRISRVYASLGDYQRGLDHTFLALRIAENQKDSSLLPSAYMQVGNLYYRAEDHETAKRFYQRSLAVARAVENHPKIAGTLNNIGLLYLGDLKLDSARQMFMDAKALNADGQFGNRSWLAINLYNLGKVEMQEGNFQKAIEYFQQSGAIRQVLKSRSGEAATFKMMGRTYQKWERNKEAKEHLLDALSIYTELGNKPGLQEVNRWLSELHFSLGDSLTGFKYYRSFVSLKDSIVGLEVRTRLSQALARYQFERDEKVLLLKQREQELVQQKELNRRTRLLYIVVMAALILLVIGFFLVKRGRDHRAANRKLEAQVAERTRELEAANRELNQYVYKASHEIRGPLSSVRGLTQLAAETNSLPEVKAYVDMMDTKVEQLDQVLLHLLESVKVQAESED